MSAPFSAPRASFFYAALGVPRLESAVPLPQGVTYWRLLADYSYSTRGPVMGSEAERREYVQSTLAAGQQPEDIFAGQFDTLPALEASCGALPWLELGGRLAYAGWDETRDNFYLFDEAGAPLVRDEERDVLQSRVTSRDNDLADAVLKAKARVYERRDGARRHTCSLGAAVKLPLGSPRNLVDAGTTDFALEALDTLATGAWSLHANLAGVLPTGSQNLFVPEADRSIDPFLAAGLGVNYQARRNLALGLQVEGNTSAFRDVAPLDGNVLTALGGARALVHGYVLEAGGGGGLTSTSCDWSGFISIGHIL